MQKFNKVLLINPPGKIFMHQDGHIGERKHCTPPLGLAYIAASLLHNEYDVNVLDILAEGYDNEIIIDSFIIYGLDIKETLSRVAEYNPDVIGIGVLFSNRINESLDIATNIKKNLPDVKIVLGGQHPTAMPKQIMKNHSNVNTKVFNTETGLNMQGQLVVDCWKNRGGEQGGE